MIFLDEHASEWLSDIEEKKAPAKMGTIVKDPKRSLHQYQIRSVSDNEKLIGYDYN